MGFNARGGVAPGKPKRTAVLLAVQAADADPAGSDEAVSLLTSLPRDEWASSRARLLQAYHVNQVPY